MPQTTKYQSGNKYYNIPDEKRENFLSSEIGKAAIKVNPYKVGDKNYNIPDDKVESFKSQFPDAKLYGQEPVNPVQPTDAITAPTTPVGMEENVAPRVQPDPNKENGLWAGVSKTLGMDEGKNPVGQFADDLGSSFMSSGKSSLASIGIGIEDQALGLAQKTEGLLDNQWWKDYNKSEQSNIKQRLSDLKDWKSGIEDPPDNTAGFIGSMAPFAGMVAASILTKSPALASATTAMFGEMGYGEGIMAYEDYKESVGEPINNNERIGSGVLYGAAMTVPMAGYLGKAMPKGLFSKTLAKTFGANPKVAGKLGSEIFEAFANKSPYLAKKLAIDISKGAGHGIMTMEAMELSKRAVDEFLIGRDVTPGEWWETIKSSAASGAAFGLMTAPFATYAQSSGNTARRKAQKNVILTNDSNGKPIELLPTTKDGKQKGMTPDGKIVDVTSEQARQAVRIPTDVFEASMQEYGKTGKVSQSFDRDAHASRITQYGKSIMDGKGNIHVAKHNTGEEMYVIRDNGDSYDVVTKSGEVRKGIPLTEFGGVTPIHVYDFHDAMMADYDAKNGVKPKLLDNSGILLDGIDPNIKTKIVSIVNSGKEKAEIEAEIDNLVATNSNIQAEQASAIYKYVQNQEGKSKLAEKDHQTIAAEIDAQVAPRVAQLQHENGRDVNIIRLKDDPTMDYFVKQAIITEEGEGIYRSDVPEIIVIGEDGELKMISVDNIAESIVMPVDEFATNMTQKVAESELADYEANQPITDDDITIKIGQTFLMPDGKTAKVAETDGNGQYAVDIEGKVTVFDINELEDLVNKSVDEEQRINSEAKLEANSEQVGNGSTPVEAEATTVQEIPKDKDGNVDYDNLIESNPAQFLQEFGNEFGQPEAISMLQGIQAATEKKLKTLQTKAAKATSPNEVAKVRREIAALQGKNQSLTNILSSETQTSEDANVEQGTSGIVDPAQAANPDAVSEGILPGVEEGNSGVPELEQPNKTEPKIESKPDQEIPIEPKGTLYSMPEADGSFKKENGGREAGKSYYVIDPKGNVGLKVSQGRAGRAINRLESYLKPVFEIENIANADDMTGIVVKKLAKVDANGKLIEKGVIELINDGEQYGITYATEAIEGEQSNESQEPIKKEDSKELKDIENTTKALEEFVEKYVNTDVDVAKHSEWFRLIHDFKGEEGYIVDGIAKAYHKAKADGSDPELVKAVENLLTREVPTKTLLSAEQSDQDNIVENNPNVKYAKNTDGTLKTKSEYTPEEWQEYTKSVIDDKLAKEPTTEQYKVGDKVTDKYGEEQTIVDVDTELGMIFSQGENAVEQIELSDDAKKPTKQQDQPQTISQLIEEKGDVPELKAKKSRKGIPKKLSETQKKALDIEVSTAYDLALKWFIGGGSINLEGLTDLFGGGRDAKRKVNSERLVRISYYKKDGLNIDDIAHELWSGHQDMFPNFTTSDYRDAAEDIVISFESPVAMSNALLDKYTEDIEKSGQDAIDEENYKKELIEQENKDIDEVITNNLKELDEKGLLLTPEEDNKLFGGIIPKDNESTTTLDREGKSTIQKGEERTPTDSGQPQPDGSGSSKSDIELTTYQKEVAKEYDTKIAKLREVLSKEQKAKDNKLAELNSRNGLFGDAGEFVGALFEAEFEPTKENFQKALEPFDNKINKIEADIKKALQGKETAIEEAGKQTKIEADNVAEFLEKETEKSKEVDPQDKIWDEFVSKWEDNPEQFRPDLSEYGLPKQFIDYFKKAEPSDVSKGHFVIPKQFLKDFGGKVRNIFTYTSDFGQSDINILKDKGVKTDLIDFEKSKDLGKLVFKDGLMLTLDRNPSKHNFINHAQIIVYGKALNESNPKQEVKPKAEPKNVVEFLEDNTKQVKPLRQGAGHTKGTFVDSDGQVYKSVWTLGQKQMEKGKLTRGKSFRTAEYEVLKGLQDMKHVPKVGKLVETNEGEMFEIETLNEIEAGTLTLDELRKIETILDELVERKVDYADIQSFMRRDNGEIVLVDFSVASANVKYPLMPNLIESSYEGLLSPEDLVIWKKEASAARKAKFADIWKDNKDRKAKKLVKKPAKPTPKEVDKIDDFGEKIEGAKKDTYSRIENVSDENLMSQPLSKSFPKPDFAKLVEDGVMDEDGAMVMKYLYSEIPSKPRKKYKQKGWAEKVQRAIDTYNSFLEDKGAGKIFIDALGKADRFGNLASSFANFQAKHKALGFPKENTTTGAYDIRKIADKDGSSYFVTKGNQIVYKSPTVEGAAKALKEILSKNKDKSKGVKLSIYKDTKTNKYFIGKKGAVGVVRLMENIDTVKEASEIFKTQQAQLQEMWDALKLKPKERRESNRTRVGTDYRNGKDITPEEFGDEFGFRGVQFGNWVNNKERKSALNDAYDALMDLSTSLGISPKALSLNGELGMAFGARGSGKASAHYESGQVVINLTKTQGAGSLAHEWWHALDSYFSRKKGKPNEFVTQQPIQGWRTEGGKAVPDERIRKEMADAFSDVVDAIRASGLPKRSAKLDQTRSKPYWSDIIEMSARSFENFIIEKLGEASEQNDYLANFKETSEWLKSGSFDTDNYPYPLKDESEAINSSFQDFFDVIEEQEDTKMLFKLSSGAEDAIPNIKQEKGSPAQMKAALLKNGAKAAELDWMEYDETFGDRKSVTKEEIEKWIKDNKVELEEVVKGDYENRDLELKQTAPFSYSVVDNTTGKIFLENASQSAATAFIDNAWDGKGDVKFSEYQTPGGENYKEWLLTIPESKYRGNRKKFIKEVKGITSVDFNNLSKKEQESILKEYDELVTNKTFKSGHFSESNIVTHTRTNERTDVDGDNVLHIEEIQSDWAQKGKKEGFKGQKFDQTKFKEWFVKNRTDKDPTYIEYLKLDIKNQKEFNDAYLWEINNDATIPNMPFQKTPQWVGLGLKRMVQEAAEKGFDKVTWTTGEQQAERYDLSKQISKINVVKNHDGTYDLGIFDKNNANTSQRQNIKEDSLSDFVGKELAEKIIAIETGGAKVFSGLDLKVGGEGMKDFYDNILPKTANKLFKKYGVKVGKTEIVTEEVHKYSGFNVKKLDNGKWGLLSGDGNLMETYESKEEAEKDFKEWITDKTTTVHSLKLTPELIKAANNGFPMFKVGNKPQAAKTAAERMSDEYVTKHSEWQAEMKKQANKIAKDLRTKINIVNTESQIPRRYANTIKARGFSGKIDAFYAPDTGEVYVILENNKNAEAMRESILHETVSHKGLRLVFGDKYESLLDDIYDQMTEEDIQELIDKKYNPKDKYEMADEFLAYKTKGAKRPNFIRRAIAKIRQWIRKMFGLKYTDNDIYSLFELSKKALKNETDPTPTKKTKGVTEFGNENIYDFLTSDKKNSTFDNKVKYYELEESQISESRETVYDVLSKRKVQDKQTVKEWEKERLPQVADALTHLVRKEYIEKKYLSDEELSDLLSLYQGISKANYQGIDNNIVDLALNTLNKKYGFKRVPESVKQDWKDTGVMAKQGMINIPKVKGKDVYEILTGNEEPKTVDSRNNSNNRALAKVSDPIQTETKAFKDWFGDSKVVDKNGKPLVVYHGTNKNFNIFNIKKGGKNTNTNGEYGFYFTQDKALADVFARKNNSIKQNANYKKGASIMPVYVSIKNPKTISAIQFTMLNKGGEFRTELIKDGYDGVIIEPFSKEDKESWIRLFGEGLGSLEFNKPQYIAFNPNQIKSATANSGKFSKENADIIASLAGEKGITDYKTINNLNIAEQMEKAGKDATTIWQKVGFERGKDGEWRYEIADHAASIDLDKLKDGVKLKDVFSHKELFKAYPVLKEYTIADNKNNTESYVDTESKIIGLRITAPSLQAGLQGQTGIHKANTLKSNLLHETQHIIQEVEGFNIGGNREEVWKALIEAKYQEIKGISTLSGYTEKQKRGFASSLLIDEMDQRTEAGAALEAYLRLAGEAEARNVQNRSKFVGEFLDKTPPSQTESRPRSKQIDKKDGVGIIANDVEKAAASAYSKIETKLNKFADLRKSGKFTTRESIKAVQAEIIAYAKKYMPIDEAGKRDIGKLLTMVKNNTNVSKLLPTFLAIDGMTTEIQKKRTIAAIDKIIKTTKPKKVNGKLQGSTHPEVYDIVEKVKQIRKIKSQEDTDAYVDGLDPNDVESVALFTMFGNLKDKDHSEVIKAQENLSQIVGEGKVWFKDQLEARKTRNTELRERVIDKMTGGEGITPAIEIKAEKSEVKDYWLKNFINKNQSFEWIMDIISQDKSERTGQGWMQDYFGDILNKATNEETSGHRAYIEMLNEKSAEIFGKEGRQLSKVLTDNSRQIKKTGVTTLNRDGVRMEVRLSQNEAYKLWQDYQDRRYSSNFEKMGFDQKSLDQLEMFIKPEVMKWAKWQLNEFYPYYYDGVNEKFKENYFVNLAKNENYSPKTIEVSEMGDKDDALLKESKVLGTVLNGSLKATVPHNNRISIVDGDMILARHIAQMEHFKAWVSPVRDLRAVFGSRGVQHVLKTKYGNNLRSVLNSQINDFARGGVDRALVISTIDKIRRNFVTAELGLNYSILPKQLVSSITYIMDIPVKEFFSGLADFAVKPKEIYDILSASEMVKTRYKTGWTHEMESALKTITPNTLSGSRTRYRQMINYMMLPTKLGDRAAIIGGWTVYKYHYNQAKKTMTDEKAKAFAMNKFERIAGRSQQSATLPNTSELQKGSVGKLFTMFHNSQQQYFRYEIAALRNLKKGRGSIGHNLKILAVTHFLLPMFFQYIANLFTDADDDKEDKRMLRAAILGSWNGLLIAGDMVEYGLEKLMGEWWGYSPSPLIGSVENMGTGIAKVYKGVDQLDTDAFIKGVDMMALSLSQTVLGVPLRPGKKLYKKATEVPGQIDRLMNPDSKAAYEVEQDVEKIVSDEKEYKKRIDGLKKILKEDKQKSESGNVFDYLKTYVQDKKTIRAKASWEKEYDEARYNKAKLVIKNGGVLKDLREEYSEAINGDNKRVAEKIHRQIKAKIQEIEKQYNK